MRLRLFFEAVGDVEPRALADMNLGDRPGLSGTSTLDRAAFDGLTGSIDAACLSADGDLGSEGRIKEGTEGDLTRLEGDFGAEGDCEALP